MNARLERRLRSALNGHFEFDDGPQKLYRDSLTDLLRLQEQVNSMEQLVFFVKGMVSAGDLPASHLKSLRRRIENMEADYRRATQRGKPPCK